VRNTATSLLPLMPTLTELHESALRGDLELPARAAAAATPAANATSLAAAHTAGALQVGTALEEALTNYLRGAHSNAARMLERTDVAYAEEDQLPRALLAVLCYLQMHRNSEKRGKMSAADFLRKTVLPKLALLDTAGRTSAWRDAIRDALRT